MVWHDAVEIDDLPQGTRQHVEREGRRITLIHTEDGVFCIDSRCPHSGGPLGDGLVEKGFIVCPLHQWRFDLRDGSHSRSATTPAAGVHRLRLQGDTIQVEL